MKFKVLLQKIFYPLYRAYTKTLQVLVSRKVMILVIATYLVMGGHITAEIWGMVALALLGAHTWIDSKKPDEPFHKMKKEEDDDDSPTAVSRRIP